MPDDDSGVVGPLVRASPWSEGWLGLGGPRPQDHEECEYEGHISIEMIVNMYKLIINFKLKKLGQNCADHAVTYYCRDMFMKQ